MEVWTDEASDADPPESRNAEGRLCSEALLLGRGENE
jgi:hypothetical protein